MRAFSLVFALAAVSSVVAHPVRQARELKIIGRDTSAKVVRRETDPIAALQLLSAGNQAFRDGLQTSEPELLQKLTNDGQSPPFMFLGCSDSRVSEGTVFNAKPGTLFTQRNIANQFHSNDNNAQSVLSYAVSELGINHVIVMGHYGCGGVGAAIASAPANQVDAANGAVQNWIEPIREIFRTSSRPEIVELRTKNAALTEIEEPDIKEPGFRALVEENVKASVARVAASSVITNHYALLAANAGNTTAGNTTAATPERRSGEDGPPTDVYIHGWVYDLENGEIRDLGISVGPPGKEIPAAPFAAVAESAVASASSHSAPAPVASPSSHEPAASTEAPMKRCEQLCKAKRSLAGLFGAKLT